MFSKMYICAPFSPHIFFFHFVLAMSIVGCFILSLDYYRRIEIAFGLVMVLYSLSF